MSDGTWNIIPYLRVSDGAKAIDFYVRAFGAKEVARYAIPDGKIGHAELDVNGAKLYLADADYETNGAPAQGKRAPIVLHCDVPDIDAAFALAVEAGATVAREPADQFYGDRNGGLVDPFGHEWFLSTHIRDVSEAEMQAAMKG
jgi:PhnB protein